MIYRKFVKRVLDLIVSLLILPLFSVVFIIVAPIIKLEDGGDIFYNAERRGKDARVFKMYKFRSMKMDSKVILASDGSTFSTDSDPRLTKVGRFLRKTSIDELPQILNVLLGDMSLIGPRPSMPNKKIEELTENDLKRLSIRPGMTGYSQAYYRNSITQDEKHKNDLYYVDNLSFKMDIDIVVRTISSVLARKNIY